MANRRLSLVAMRSGMVLGLTLIAAACGPSEDGVGPAWEADAPGASVARLAESRLLDSGGGCRATPRLIAPLSGSASAARRASSASRDPR